MLIEVKSSSKNSLGKSLQKYKETLKCPLAFQVVFDLPGNNQANEWLVTHAIEKGQCDQAVILPVSSFLSLLV